MDMKTSKRIPPGTPKYHRQTSENRIIIWTLKKEGKSETYIAGCNEIFMQSQRGLAAENAKDARLMPRSRPASGL